MKKGEGLQYPHFYFIAFLLGVAMARYNKDTRIHSFPSFPLSWETILVEYKQALETAGKSRRTIDGYLENSRKYFTFLETEGLIKPIHNLGKKELREYVMHLQNRARWPNNPHIKEESRGRLSPFAVRAYARDIKTLWSWLHREGYIDENPLANFALPTVPENLTKIITPEQFKYLLSNIMIDRKN